MTDTKPIHRIAIIGTAVIGASWTALCFKNKFSQLCCGVSSPLNDWPPHLRPSRPTPCLKKLG